MKLPVQQGPIYTNSKNRLQSSQNIMTSWLILKELHQGVSNWDKKMRINCNLYRNLNIFYKYDASAWNDES